MNLAENILFWFLILSVIGVVLWLAFGSPEFNTSILMAVIFVAGSEILLWKTLFGFDKRTAVGFEKVRGGFKLMNNKLINIERDVSEIKSILKKK